MKKILIVLLGILVISCGLIDFDFDADSKGKIERIVMCPPGVSSMIPDELKNNLTDQFNNIISNSFDDIIKEVKKQDTWPADEISIKKLVLKQINPPSHPETSTTLGLISSLKIYISYKDDSGEFLLASIKNSDDKAQELIFDTDKKNIVDYIDKGFKLKIDASVRDCPAVDIDFKSIVTAHIKL
jgi:hypothetical protein